MSLPYMPGWWDEISKNATSLVGQLPQMIQPDRVANKKLQDMVQQNPMLLEQFSNMDEGTRNMLAQSLGFKNENPIAKLPVGAARKEREQTQQYISGLSPEQNDRRMAKKTGTDTTKQIAREGILEGREDETYEITKKVNNLNFEKLSSDVPLGKLLNAEKERTLTRLNELRTRSGGKLDAQRVADSIINGRATPQDMEAYAVIKNEPGMGDALDMMLEMGKLGKQNKYSMGLRLAGMQDDFTRLAISSVNGAASEYDRSSRIVNKIISDAALAKISIEEALKADPERKRMYDEAIIVRDESKQRLDMFKPLVQTGFERMGVKFPDVVPPPTAAQAPANETPLQRLARLKAAAGIK